MCKVSVYTAQSSELFLQRQYFHWNFPPWETWYLRYTLGVILKMSYIILSRQNVLLLAAPKDGFRMDLQRQPLTLFITLHTTKRIYSFMVFNVKV